MLIHNQIIEYRFIKVFYKSQETWREATDYLRCNPLFYGEPRYDHVLLPTEDRDIFAKLLFVFSISIGGTDYPFIMVKPLDGEVVAENRDKDLGLYRVSPGIRPMALFPATKII